MGQSASTPSSERRSQAGRQSSSQAQSSRRPTTGTFWRRTAEASSAAPSEAHSAPRPRTNRTRPASVNRLSQLFLSPTSTPNEQSGTTPQPAQRPSFASRLQRHSLFLGAPNSLFARRSNSANHDAEPVDTLWPAEQIHATASSVPHSPTGLTLPQLDVPDLDLDFTLSSSASGPTSRTPSRRPSTRLASTLSDRLAAIRPNRHQSTGGAVLRRRRSPLAPGEENTVLLSRLLSVAAATTAETLLEGSGETMANARGHASEGDDGSFGSFLQSLESGRLAAALRQPMQPPPGSPSSAPAPLNFFRVFRFGAQPASRNNARAGNNGDHRMVPIIIVGIRAVPNNGNGAEEHTVPPFLDALSNLPTTPLNPSLGQELGESIRPQNGSRFSARRRASMGGLSRFPLGYDNQRHHRSPERQRPASVASEIASWPRPPPATPASPNLSTVNSREHTPSPTVAPSRRSSYSGNPRRESIIRTTTTTTLETTTEDTTVRTRPPRQRRMSESDHRTSFPSTRRNGIVEPDNGTLPENTRSWIIYVLGGSYPENHPILTTPSLFTDSPTYEDMMLLSSLLGPVKPPVASDTDIASAGGIYKVEETINEKGQAALVAAAVEGETRIELAAEQRCLVCLCDMEKGEEARRLNGCGHLFHRECIDEWLTKGRNSCPLCRAQGVQENKKDKPEAPPVDSTAPSPVIPSTELGDTVTA